MRRKNSMYVVEIHELIPPNENNKYAEKKELFTQVVAHVPMAELVRLLNPMDGGPSQCSEG